jgi:HK97 gp10 family phage protein
MAMTSVVYNRFPEIARQFGPALHKVIVQTVDVIATTADANAPKRTGWMASTIYKVTSDGSTYGQTNGAAPGDAYLLPEGPEVSDPYTGYAAVAADYGIFVEMGTRYQAAQPYFYPAVEEGRKRLNDAIAVFESFLE